MKQIICLCGQTLNKGDKYYEIDNEIWCENCIDQFLTEKEKRLEEDD